MMFQIDPGGPPGDIRPLENPVPNQEIDGPRAMLPLVPVREQQHHDVKQHAGLGHGQHDEMEPIMSCVPSYCCMGACGPRIAVVSPSKAKKYFFVFFAFCSVEYPFRGSRKTRPLEPLVPKILFCGEKIVQHKHRLFAI